MNSDGKSFIERAICKTSCLKVFYKKGVLIVSAKLTGNHMFCNLFLNKVAGYWLIFSLKRDFTTGVLLRIL